MEATKFPGGEPTTLEGMEAKYGPTLLAGCPHCGGAALLYTGRKKHFTGTEMFAHWAQCRNCGATGGKVFTKEDQSLETQLQAAHAWNKRVTH